MQGPPDPDLPTADPGTLPLDETVTPQFGPTPIPARIGRFEVRRFLGAGSFGRVYEAFDTSLQRAVALKVAKPAQLADEALIERFHREARAAANLMHPHIVAVFDSGRDGLHHYIAAAFVPGQSLAAALAALPPGQTMSPRQAATVTRKLAEALAYAHRSGIVHRDVKPGNVLLRDDGEPLLADFGLAARTDGGDKLTQAGAVLGTPEYIAPEQWLGNAGPASDQYSLGCLLFELLTRHLPFGGGSAEHYMLLHAHQPAPSPRKYRPDIPRDLETITLKCLEKDPARRYPDCQALADDLRRWLDGEPVTARPPGQMELLARWARRSPALAGSLLAIILLAVIAGSLITWQWRRAASALADVAHERKQKALARADALCTAVPAAVPAILDELTEGGDEVLPRLREIRDGGGPKQRRMRAALALLASEPDAMRDELTDWMLEAPDPAEVLLVREALAPHAEALRARLWREAGQTRDAGRRFRALVALAAFDRDGVGWRGSAAHAAGELLAANPLHLGAWMEGLRPVRLTLLPAIKEAFRGNGPPEARPVATRILADYADDQPGLIAEALIEAEVGQVALLRPLMQKHAEPILARLRREVDWPLHFSVAPPPDPAWAGPADALRKEVEGAGGIVSERFAMCQALPLARLKPVLESMGRAGYRPVSARPWVGGAARAAVAWRRDGGEWKYEDGLTAAAARERNEAARKTGMVPIDVAPYPDAGGERFALLWRKRERDEQAVLYLASTVAGHPAITRDCQQRGFRPCVLRASVGPWGTRLSGIWRGREGDNPEGPPFWRQASFLDEATHAVRVRTADMLQLDVEVTPPRPMASRDVRVEAEMQRETRTLNATPADQQARFRRGRAYFLLHRDEEAIADLSATPGVPASLLARAALHARAGRAAKARADLAEYRRLARPTASEALVADALIDAYLGVGDGLKALDAAADGGAFDAELAVEAAKAHALAAKAHMAALAARAVSLVGNPTPWAPPPDASAVTQHSARAVTLLDRGLRAGRGGLGSLQDEADWDALPDRAAARAAFLRAGATRRYASVWREDVKTESECLFGVSAERHLALCRDLMNRGYVPAALSLSRPPGEAAPLAASVWHRAVATDEGREWAARRQAAAGALLLQAGRAQDARRLWRLTTSPSARPHLIALAGPLGADPRVLLRELDEVEDASSLRAIVLALGEFSAKDMPEDVRRAAVKKLLAWYETHPDAGLHGAIDWLLRHGKEGPDTRALDWGQGKELERIDRALARRGPPEKGRRWLVNGQGQTMAVVVGPSSFRQGSPVSEQGRTGYETPRWVTVPRTFAIGTKLVTLAEWNRFRRDVGADAIDPASRPAGGAGPTGGLTWFEAARYCNWLSKVEGIPRDQWCYPDPVAERVRPFPDYLRRKGYRLPTDAEWELACRAGTDSACYFGASTHLLPRYAIFHENSRGRPWPVGQKRPNDLGLFDMHGNSWQWCHGVFPEGIPPPYPRADREETLEVVPLTHVHTRGGSYIAPPAMGRSAYTAPNMVAYRSQDMGLRVVRTLE